MAFPPRPSSQPELALVRKSLTGQCPSQANQLKWGDPRFRPIARHPCPRPRTQELRTVTPPPKSEPGARGEGETRTPGSGVNPKELELLSIAVRVEIRAGRIQANADQLDKLARQNTRGLRVVFIFTHVAAHVGSHSLSGDIPAPLITNLDSGSLIPFERLLESLSKRQIS